MKFQTKLNILNANNLVFMDALHESASIRIGKALSIYFRNVTLKFIKKILPSLLDQRIHPAN